MCSFMELKHAGSIVPDSSILYRQHYDHCITFIPSVLHSSHSICHISEVNTKKKTQHSAVFFCPICTSVLQKRHMQCTPSHSTYWGSVVSWWNTWACEDFEQVWSSSITTLLLSVVPGGSSNPEDEATHSNPLVNGVAGLMTVALSK